MRCTDAGELMSLLLDGYIDSARQAALRAHTADCAACQAEWRAIQEIDALLVSASLMYPPLDFTARVIARLPHQSREFSPLWGTLVLLAGVVVLALALLLPANSTMPTLWKVFQYLGSVGPRILTLTHLISLVFHLARLGRQIWQVMLDIANPGLILLHAVLALTALIFWLRLVTGVQGILRMRDP